jgi:hypothetical protein
LSPDGLLFPDDQQHLGPDHLLAAGEQGLGIILIFSINSALKDNDFLSAANCKYLSCCSSWTFC